MNIDHLKQIASQGEGYHTEFKKSVNSDLQKEMVSFANSSGGAIYIGIDDDGNISGTNISNELYSRIQSTASDCDPPVHVQINKIGSNGLQIIVEEGTVKPYRCTKGFYIRNGANAQKIKTDAITEFIEKEGRICFDEQIRRDVGVKSNFSVIKWNYFSQLANITPNQKPVFILKSLGVIKEIDGSAYFTNAGVLIFSDNPNLYLPQATISCVLYKGSEKLDIIDRKEFDSDLISNINAAMQFLERHINISAKIEGLQRQNIWEIPEVALREAVVNAVVHRDYLEKGARVAIEIFDNRIVISNPGGLAKGLSEKDFGKFSLTRNSLLASLMLRANYIEKLGTGVARINNAMMKANLPKATFEFGTFFSVVFDREKSSEKSSEKIIKLIINDKNISAKDIAGKIGISARAVEKQLTKLKSKNLLKRVGSPKGGYWEIISKETE